MWVIPDGYEEGVVPVYKRGAALARDFLFVLRHGSRSSVLLRRQQDVSEILSDRAGFRIPLLGCSGG